MPEIGRQRNAIAQCAFGRPYESFGSQVAPVSTAPGKVSWIITHDRCDVPPGQPLPTELLLYRSVDGSLPPAESGERIGPRELLSETHLLAVGDWDNSGMPDLCCRVQLFGDTSAGNHTGYDVASVVVFWADSLGNYSIDDTTRLECDAQMWLGIKSGLGTDRNGDGIDDLFIITDLGLSNGRTVEQARGRIYFGHNHKRWGRDGIKRTTDWRWWGAPIEYSDLVETDQDGDGNLDIAFHTNAHAGTGAVSVLYGRSSGLPDTNELETVDLQITNGHASRLMDISNDGVPELVVHCGSLEELAIFVGIKGQRLIEQFGPGLERLDTARGDRWWTKPFARVWLPYRINDAWPGSTWDAVYDLGDANGDGYRDIWIHAQPFLLCYSSGAALDSLVDAMIDLSPFGVPTSLQTLGPLDGYPKAFVVGTTDGVIYAHPDNQIPARSNRTRRWPDGTLGPRLEAENDKGSATPAARLDVIPNPSSGDVELRWNRDVQNGTLIVSDVAGHEVLRVPVDRAARGYIIDCSSFAPGVYLASLHGTHVAITTQIVIQ